MAVFLRRIGNLVELAVSIESEILLHQIEKGENMLEIVSEETVSEMNQNSSIHERTLMEEAEIVLDVEASHLSESIKCELNKLWGGPNKTENFTIFRAPRNIRQSKKNLFEPSVISIGPFHHGQTGLRTMEAQKWRFLRDFLSHVVSVDFCISEMKKLEKETRRCYSETVDLDSNDFVKMMLLDGCFVLEYFLKQKEKNWDTIFEVGWNATFVQSDLFLLENQIPFFVVEKLCKIGIKQEDRKNLFLLNNFINNISTPLQNYPLISKPPAQIDHLAHLFHHCSVPNLEESSSSNRSLSSKSFHLTRMLSLNRIKDLLLWFLSWVLTRFSRSTSTSTEDPWTLSIPCASYLQDVGIKFRPKRTPKHMFDISFDQGVLEIPKLKIVYNSKPHLVNLIAFEQCKFGKINVTYFSSYAAFLDLLVSSQKDMAILQQCGIIESMLSGEEELTLFFNQLFEGVGLLEDHVFAELFTKLNRYCESNWNRHRAKLIRDYFSSPWTMISLVAALVLLVFTFLQSFFAVYAYFVPPS
ncbi:UPF0481 protein At3g47200-like [Carex rostrata]